MNEPSEVVLQQSVSSRLGWLSVGSLLTLISVAMIRSPGGWQGWFCLAVSAPLLAYSMWSLLRPYTVRLDTSGFVVDNGFRHRTVAWAEVGIVGIVERRPGRWEAVRWLHVSTKAGRQAVRVVGASPDEALQTFESFRQRNAESDLPAHSDQRRSRGAK